MVRVHACISHSSADKAVFTLHCCYLLPTLNWVHLCPVLLMLYEVTLCSTLKTNVNSMTATEYTCGKKKKVLHRKLFKLENYN